MINVWPYSLLTPGSSSSGTSLIQPEGNPSKVIKSLQVASHGGIQRNSSFNQWLSPVLTLDTFELTFSMGLQQSCCGLDPGPFLSDTVT